MSRGGGAEPRWRADGRELFYVSADRRLMVVPTTIGPAFEAGTPAPLFEMNVRDLGFPFRQRYDVTPDGQRFVVQELTGRVQSVRTDCGRELVRPYCPKTSGHLTNAERASIASEPRDRSAPTAQESHTVRRREKSDYFGLSVKEFLYTLPTARSPAPPERRRSCPPISRFLADPVPSGFWASSC